MAKRTTDKSTAKRTAAKAAPKRRSASAATKTKQTRSAKATGTRGATATKRRNAASVKVAGTKTTRATKASSKKSAVKAEAKKSTRSKTVVASKEAPEATSQDPIQFSEQKPLPKTHLAGSELREFRELLLQKRAELAGDVQRLADEALFKKGGGHGDRSSMPIHMADLGTDNWEQEFTLGLLASEQALVREIDDALSRIRQKTYGVCLATRNKISKARLRAKPWAKFCIEYARAREEGRAL